VFEKYATHLRKQRKHRLVLGDERSKRRRELHEYLNNFHLLREKLDEPVMETPSRSPSGWQQLKERYPSVPDVDKKIAEVKKRGGSKGYLKVLERLRRYWEKRGKC